MKKLYFDIQMTGHHSEYISHLIDYLYDNADTDEYYFVVHPDFSSKFPSITDKTKSCKNIFWITVTKEEYTNCFNSNLISNSFTIYKLMNKYAIQLNVDSVCLLYFNVFQFAAIFYRPSYSLTGILFLQFYRMNKNSLKDKLKYYRKRFITKLYTLNPNIKTIFILNDQKTVGFLNKEFNTNIFKMLPDPIAQLTPLVNFDLYDYYESPKNRKVFLHIGSLGERKGTFEIIDSVMHLSIEKQSEVFILLVGKPENKITEQIILDKIKSNSKISNVKIVWDNQFVENAMMKSLFDQSFAVLLPYKNTEASSGILGHAAAANKMVIATGTGLIKEIIEENKLGVLLDAVTPEEIADKMTLLLSTELSFRYGNSFIEDHSPIKFAELII